jgi:hypothetical protein
MKTKKFILYLIFSLCSAFLCSAQDDESSSGKCDDHCCCCCCSFRAGLNLSIGAPSNIEWIGTIQTNTTRSYNNSSLGAGFDIDVFGEFKVTRSLSLGVDAGYNLGFPITGSYDNVGYVENYSIVGNMFYINPYLKLSAREHEPKFSPFVEFGPIIGFPMVTETYTESGSQATPGTYTDVYSGGVPFGWKGGVGVDFRLIKDYPNLKLHIEIGEKNISYMPEIETNTTTYSGWTLYPQQKFVDNYNYSNPEPNTQLRKEFPFSNFYVSAGASLRIGDKHSKKSEK